VPTYRTSGHHVAHVLETELDAAILALKASSDLGVAVHEARKRLKKVRALWRLIRRRGHTADTTDRALGRVAHRLSSVRDADARMGALRLLGRRYPRLVTDAVVHEVTGFLEQARRRTDRQARRTLRQARRDLGTIRIAVVRHARAKRDPRRAIEQFQRDYRKARKATRRLSWNKTAADFHAWRRKVKRHAYQMRLLEGKTVRATMARLKTLEHRLGEAHDLDMLRAALLAGRRAVTRDRATALVLGASVLLEISLRRRAVALGQTLFAKRRLPT